MIKIIITNNDNLCTILSETLIETKNIEIKNIDNLDQTIIDSYIRTGTNIIFFSSDNYIELLNVLKFIQKNIDDVIILLSNRIILNELLSNSSFVNSISSKKNLTNTPKNKIYNRTTNTDAIEEYIISMLLNLKFTLYNKGTIYLKDAIFTAFYNEQLLLDTHSLIMQVAKINNENYINVRSNIDKCLNSTLDFLNTEMLYDTFEYYDGRKVSLKYFVYLFVYTLKKQIDTENTAFLKL